MATMGWLLGYPWGRVVHIGPLSSIPLFPVAPDPFVVCAVHSPPNDEEQERTQAYDLKPIHF